MFSIQFQYNCKYFHWTEGVESLATSYSLLAETHFSWKHPMSRYITGAWAGAQVSEARWGVTRHQAQWPGPSRRKYLSLLRQKIFGAKKNMFTELGRHQEVMVSSDKGSLGDCSQNPLGVPKVPLLQQGDTLLRCVWMGLVWSVIFPRIESIPVSRTQQVHIHHNIPRARCQPLSHLPRGKSPATPCLFV